MSGGYGSFDVDDETITSAASRGREKIADDTALP
jgi:hypothetical protein